MQGRWPKTASVLADLPARNLTLKNLAAAELNRQGDFSSRTRQPLHTLTVSWLRRRVLGRKSRPCLLSPKFTHPERTNKNEHHQRGYDVGSGRNLERCGPAPGFKGNDTPQGHKKRGAPLGGIQQRVICCRVFLPKVVGRKRRKYAEDIAPGEKDQARQDHKIYRIFAVFLQA